MKNHWRLEDLIDLEYFLHRVEQEETTDLQPTAQRERDRKIYLQQIVPRLADGHPRSRMAILMLWLEAHRQLEKEETGREAIMPGELFSQVLRLVTGGLFLGGIVSGWLLAASLLSYRGTEPVNVSLYISLLVLTQAGLVAGTVFLLLLRRLNWRVSGGFLYSLLRVLLTTVMGRLRRKLGGRVSVARREDFAAVLGLIKGKTVHGNLIFWPLFGLAQTFGVGFNLGCLTSTGLRVVGTDLAFGWQSTLQLSAETVHRLVQGLSLPWSWALPAEIAAPSLSQIEGSRMILKDGIYRLATADLVAWWPFLLLALCCYGLAPRLLLLLVGKMAQHRSLARLDFNNSSCDRLMQRLQRPAVRLEGTTTPALTDAAEIESQRQSAKLALDDKHSMSGVALIPDDLFDNCSQDRLTTLVRQVFGITIIKSIRIGQGLAADQQIFNHLTDETVDSTPSPVFMLQEAWHPPIRETLIVFQEIRAILGRHGRIAVGLIGKPTAETIFTPTTDSDWQTWRKKIASLGDPNLRLERLVEDTERHDS